MLEAGDSLSHFRLVARIGEGGSGRVWRAVDKRSDRDLAIKILPAARASDPEKMARLEDESRALVALGHPNIVAIQSVEASAGTHFLTLELVRGKSLVEHIPKSGLPLQRFFELALPLIDATRCAHGIGMIHRDLKPGNVMVSDDGEVKVLGFGLSEIREREVDPDLVPDDVPTLTLTTDGTTQETMPYLSPEQVTGKPLDHRSDVFSLGTILYEMATGRRPFGGESTADIIVSILRDEPRRVTELRPGLPGALERLVHRSLEKNRERRFQNVQDLHDELVGLRTNHG